jgi:hypothetical protein
VRMAPAIGDASQSSESCACMPLITSPHPWRCCRRKRRGVASDMGPACTPRRAPAARTPAASEMKQNGAELYGRFVRHLHESDNCPADSNTCAAESSGLPPTQASRATTLRKECFQAPGVLRNLPGRQDQRDYCGQRHNQCTNANRLKKSQKNTTMALDTPDCPEPRGPVLPNRRGA